MDKLSDLPPKDDVTMTPQETEVMKKYFNEPGTGDKKPKTGWMDTIKLALYASVLFLILANPWVDTILCAVPYCGDNVFILLALKVLLFMILFVVMYKCLVIA